MKGWLSQSFFRQVGLLFLAFSVLSISGYAYHNYTVLRQQWRDTVQTQASNVTAFIALTVSSDVRYVQYFDLWSKLKSLQKQSERKERGTIYRLREIAVLDNLGNVVGDTDPMKHPLMQPYHNDSGASAATARPGNGFRSIRTVAPIQFGGENVGSLFIEFDITPFSQFLRRHLRDFAVYLGMVTFASVAFGLALARWITRPLAEVRAVLPMLGSGNITMPDMTARQDEFGQLGRAIESADRRIREDEQQIRMHRDHLEDTVRQRTAELVASNKELEAFSYSVSHDLRAPLRAIDGFSQALSEDYGDKLDETAKAYLQRVRGGAQKMGGLIDDMLQLSRVTRHELKYTEVDLSTIVRQIMLGLRAGEPEREAEVIIAPDLRISADEGLMRILLQNLLGNAWKYTGKKHLARIEFGSLRASPERIFFVRDNGAGFDMRYVSKLFVAFQRLHTLDEFPGSGIGLATVQRIVNRHGGRVWAEGEVNEGSSFYFAFPERVMAG